MDDRTEPSDRDDQREHVDRLRPSPRFPRDPRRGRDRRRRRPPTWPTSLTRALDSRPDRLAARRRSNEAIADVEAFVAQRTREPTRRVDRRRDAAADDRRNRRTAARRRPTGLVRELGLLDATMIVMGSMIGSGIFITSAESARLVGAPGWLLVAWVLAGLMTITGALCCGRARRDDAPGRRPVRLPPRGLQPAVRLPVRLGDVPGRPDRHDRGGGRRVRQVPRRLLPRDRRRRLPRRADPSGRLCRQPLDAAARRRRPDRRADGRQHARA